MKVCIVGAGSTYTPELVDGFIRAAGSLGLSRLSLTDIDHGRLEVVGGFVSRMVSKAGSPFDVVVEQDRRRAVEGSSFVVVQIRVGGQVARHRDTVRALQSGLVGQETTGFAGFAKAMRTIPAMLEICRDVRDASPNAWVLNFTNPSGIVTEALIHHGLVNVIGLCNAPLSIQMELARRFGACAEEVRLEWVGLNHLGWARRVFVRGNDVTRAAVEGFALDEERRRAEDGPRYPREFIEALGMLPSPYLRYYYLTSEMVRHLSESPVTRAQEVMEIESRLMDVYRDQAQADKPALLGRRGGAHYSTVAVSLVSAITLDADVPLVVNVQNGQALPDLPPDAVVEVTCEVGAGGPRPVACGGLEPEIRGLVQAVKAYEQLTVRAAVTRSRRLALLALIANPLVGSPALAAELLDYLVAEYGGRGVTLE